MSRFAEVVLAVIQATHPEVPAERAELISEAVATVSQEFNTHPMIAATLMTAVNEESSFALAVHSGEKRGLAGEVCLTQIHPKNGFWKHYVDDFEDLAGTGLEATTNCLRTAARTLGYGLRRCQARHYKTNWAQAMWTYYHYGSRCWLSPHAYHRTDQMLHWQSLLWAEEKRRATEE